MNFDKKTYLEMEKELWEECQEAVKNGKMTEEADFRFYMVRDEILWLWEME